MTTTNYLKTALLLGLLTGLILLCGSLLGGKTGMVIALGLAAAMVIQMAVSRSREFGRLFSTHPPIEERIRRLLDRRSSEVSER